MNSLFFTKDQKNISVICKQQMSLLEEQLVLLDRIDSRRPLGVSQAVAFVLDKYIESYNLLKPIINERRLAKQSGAGAITSSKNSSMLLPELPKNLKLATLVDYAGAMASFEKEINAVITSISDKPSKFSEPSLAALREIRNDFLRQKDVDMFDMPRFMLKVEEWKKQLLNYQELNALTPRRRSSGSEVVKRKSSGSSSSASLASINEDSESKLPAASKAVLFQPKPVTESTKKAEPVVKSPPPRMRRMTR